MRTQIRSAVVILALLTVITGVLYPLAVTVVGQVLFLQTAEGSLIVTDNGVIGSSLIGQASADMRYFWPRPSASDYDTFPSGATNEGPTSASRAAAAAARAAFLRAAHRLPADTPLPPDLLTASGSGLDPHISPAAARVQIDRVAEARGFDDAQRQRLRDLVEARVEPPQLFILGQPRVNVLRLNLALDRLAPG